MASSNTATMRFNERWSSGAPLHTQPFEGPFVIIYPFFPFFFSLGSVSIKRCVGQVYLGVSGLTRSGRKKRKKNTKNQIITKQKKVICFSGMLSCYSTLCISDAHASLLRSLFGFGFSSFLSKRVHWLGFSLTTHSRVSVGKKFKKIGKY